MKSLRVRLLIAALAVMLGAALAKSQTADAPPMRGHEFGMGGPMMGFFAKYLDLSDAQREQMKAVMQKERPALQPTMQQLTNWSSSSNSTKKAPTTKPRCRL